MAAAGVAVQVVRVDVERHESDGGEGRREDDGHVVGGADADGGHVGAGAGAHVGDAILKGGGVTMRREEGQKVPGSVPFKLFPLTSNTRLLISDTTLLS